MIGIYNNYTDVFQHLSQMYKFRKADVPSSTSADEVEEFCTTLFKFGVSISEYIEVRCLPEISESISNKYLNLSYCKAHYTPACTLPFGISWEGAASEEESCHQIRSTASMQISLPLPYQGDRLGPSYPQQDLKSQMYTINSILCILPLNYYITPLYIIHYLIHMSSLYMI